MNTTTRLPWLLRTIRSLAYLQFVLSAIGVIFYLSADAKALMDGLNTAAVTLELEHARNGQVTSAGYDSLLVSKQTHPYQLIPKSEKLALVYREDNFAKRAGLNLLGVMNKAGGRSSLPLVLYSMLTGLLLYRILRGLSLESPFTEENARRIRWLGLLTIGLDVYQYVAYFYLKATIPNINVPGKLYLASQYVILDPAGKIGAWKFGLVLLVIAAVYQRGVEMAREAELTV
ncbi:DUF2975 domain-containing protein [Hymenobacter persicinus]|uniref:DUF2975 domain-containing protein n=1 Tax=Hymenobacter persicinus TaxID=2025506 RepID=A0A4Q5LC52_9BACT|nr:DUF2975 domain-containing protein [Hymenobacter persicinus]RYU78768.1 DUF2975 domain-containing protein [Hymenobacter persicinus]